MPAALDEAEAGCTWNAAASAVGVVPEGDLAMVKSADAAVARLVRGAKDGGMWLAEAAVLASAAPDVDGLRDVGAGSSAAVPDGGEPRATPPAASDAEVGAAAAAAAAGAEGSGLDDDGAAADVIHQDGCTCGACEGGDAEGW